MGEYQKLPLTILVRSRPVEFTLTGKLSQREKGLKLE